MSLGGGRGQQQQPLGVERAAGAPTSGQVLGQIRSDVWHRRKRTGFQFVRDDGGIHGGESRHPSGKDTRDDDDTGWQAC